MIRTPSLECASDVLNLSANHLDETKIIGDDVQAEQA